MTASVSLDRRKTFQLCYNPLGPRWNMQLDLYWDIIVRIILSPLAALQKILLWVTKGGKGEERWGRERRSEERRKGPWPEIPTVLGGPTDIHSVVTVPMPGFYLSGSGSGNIIVHLLFCLLSSCTAQFAQCRWLEGWAEATGKTGKEKGRRSTLAFLELLFLVTFPNCSLCLSVCLSLSLCLALSVSLSLSVFWPHN